MTCHRPPASRDGDDAAVSPASAATIKERRTHGTTVRPTCGSLRHAQGKRTLLRLGLPVRLVALASEMVAPQYLDPNHHLFIFIIGTLGMWRYGNAIVHYLRGMYFLHWKFPRIRKAVERMGDAALPAHMFMVVTSFRIPTHTTFKVYQSVFQEVQRLKVPCTVIASIVEKGDEHFIKDIMRNEVKGRDDIVGYRPRPRHRQA